MPYAHRGPARWVGAAGPVDRPGDLPHAADAGVRHGCAGMPWRRDSRPAGQRESRQGDVELDVVGEDADGCPRFHLGGLQVAGAGRPRPRPHAGSGRPWRSRPHRRSGCGDGTRGRGPRWRGGGPSTCRHPCRPPSRHCGRAAAAPTPVRRSPVAALWSAGRDGCRPPRRRTASRRTVRLTLDDLGRGGPALRHVGWGGGPVGLRWHVDVLDQDVEFAAAGQTRRRRRRRWNGRSRRAAGRLGRPAPGGQVVDRTLKAAAHPYRGVQTSSASLRPPWRKSTECLLLTPRNDPDPRSTSQIFQEWIRSATSGTRRRASRIFRTRSDRAP